MTIDFTTIITALITAAIPAFVTLWTSKGNKEDAEKQAKRSNILSLITMDKVNWHDGKLPVNQVTVHKLYDEYKAMGGNSFIVDVIKEYDDWLMEIEKNKKSGTPN